MRTPNHLVLIPLKEPDLTLRMVVASRPIDPDREGRDLVSDAVVARGAVRLHNLNEGEVLEGWFKLRSADSSVQDHVDIEPAVANRPSVWDQCAPSLPARVPFPLPHPVAGHPTGQFVSETSGGPRAYRLKQERRPRPVFDSLQARIAASLGEPVPAAPAPLREHPDWPFSHRIGESDTAEVSVPAATAESRDAHRPSSTGSSVQDINTVAPFGAVHMRMCVLRASSLKEAVGARAGGGRGPPGHVALVDHCFSDWQSSAVSGQRGCLFVKVCATEIPPPPPPNVPAPGGDATLQSCVQVHRAHGLAIWKQGQGYREDVKEETYDTLCSACLLPLEPGVHRGGEVQQSRIIENNQDPAYNAEFSFLDERVAQRLELTVKNTAAAIEMRPVAHRLGTVSILLYDIAHCPDSKVCACMPPRPPCACAQGWCGVRVAENLPALQVTEVPLDVHHPRDPDVVTGTVVVSLEWVPINSAPPPPYPSPALPRLLETERGDLFVRIIRAIDLPPVDTDSISCNASVRLRAAGQTFCGASVPSLCPVWLEVGDVHASVFRLEHVSELDELHVAVEHTTEASVMPAAGRTRVRAPSFSCTRAVHTCALTLATGFRGILLSVSIPAAAALD